MWEMKPNKLNWIELNWGLPGYELQGSIYTVRFKDKGTYLEVVHQNIAVQKQQQQQQRIFVLEDRDGNEKIAPESLWRLFE